VSGTWIERGGLCALSVIAIGDGIRIIAFHSATFGAYHAGGYLILLGVLIGFLTTLTWARGESGPRPSSENKTEKKGIPKPVVLCLAILAGSAILIPFLGYMISTVLFFLAYFRILGGYRWPRALALSIGLGVVFAYIFSVAGMMLPQGPVPWP
jgi:hypothetical protein